MTLRDKLTKLKTENGLTTEALSERSGVPKGTINKLLNGETRNPTAQTLRRLADALGCDLQFLCGNPAEIPGVFRFGDTQSPPHPDLMPVHRRKIPLIGAIAAGQPILCEEEIEITDCADGVHADFALRVSGDSMTGARIHDGDLVFIRLQDDVDDGEIAAVVLNDEATLKRVYHIKNGLQLLPMNPAYAPMIFTFDQCSSIRILGKAVGFQSSL